MKTKKIRLKNVEELVKQKKKERTPSAQHSSLTVSSLKDLFQKNKDVQFTELAFNDDPITLVYCSGLVHADLLKSTIPKRLEKFFAVHNGATKENIHSLHVPSLQIVTEKEKAAEDIFSGMLLIVFPADKLVVSVDIADRPQRKPEETNTEVSIKGPRDNFIEDITINHALIRKRLRTVSLASESFEVGRRSKTKVLVLYMDDISDKATLEQIRQQIEKIDIDALVSGTQLGELMNDDPYAFFPRHSYTGRPDFAVQSLLQGRFIILIDGVAYAYITPVNLFFLLKSAEDMEYPYAFNSFERLLRVAGISIATFLPGFWVALTSFHQNQLPLTLLATVVESRSGVPFPTALEAILMMLLFELFREAGLRMPLAIGQTLSVVGGLIIGDAAIRAGLTSPSMLVVIAGSFVAMTTLVNQSFIGVISLLRFFVIILVALFGFFGFFAAIFLIGIYAARIRTFGVPYLELATRLSWKNILKAMMRLPAQKDDKRASMLDPIDATKKDGRR
ncbi:spore germination protein [Bacillus sp. PK3_68]|uniref:spore germination protein n=1 Tax=Bacillus sp. PK3_68 TaxID=2027408 RepID=UPI000E757B68|nr:spore germination protein [Bacillus sp. PK3_68]RJS61970.1 spore germination protein [Bacillus sp. PK3_68]